MRKYFLMAALITFHWPLLAQEWQTDYDTAKAISQELKRPIIMVFQGSDWCAPCIKLDREVWSTEEFKSYAEDHFVMLKVDFPRKSKNALPKEQQVKNNELAAKFNEQGLFPLVVVLNEEGKVAGRTGYKQMSPHDYIKHLSSF